MRQCVHSCIGWQNGVLHTRNHFLGLNAGMRAFVHWLCFGLNAAMRAFVHWLCFGSALGCVLGSHLGVILGCVSGVISGSINS